MPTIFVFNPNSIGKSFQTKALKQKGVLKFMPEKCVDSYLGTLLVVAFGCALDSLSVKRHSPYTVVTRIE